MKRRVDGANCHSVTFHFPEQSFKIVFLEWQKFLQSFSSIGFVVGDNHFLHKRQSIFVEEHVFGAAESDAFGAERFCNFCVARNVGIGANFQSARAVYQFHESAEFSGKSGFDGRHFTKSDVASAAIYAYPIAFFYHGRTYRKIFLCSSTRTLSHPATQHFPIPRATTAA